MRSDARANRARIVAAAKIELAKGHPLASVNEIVRRAAIGPGTLYRHFPTVQDLVAAVISDDLEAICLSSLEPSNNRSPDEALTAWLRALAAYTMDMNELILIELTTELASGSATDLAACNELVCATGLELLTRAQGTDSVRRSASVGDLLMMVYAIVWASQKAPHDEHLLDRLFALALESLR